MSSVWVPPSLRRSAETSIPDSKPCEDIPSRFQRSFVPAAAATTAVTTTAAAATAAATCKPCDGAVWAPSTTPLSKAAAPAAAAAAAAAVPSGVPVWQPRNKTATTAAAAPKLDISDQSAFPTLGGKRPGKVATVAPVTAATAARAVTAATAATTEPVAAVESAKPAPVKSFANIVKNMAEKAAEEAARAAYAVEEAARLRLKEEREREHYHSIYTGRDRMHPSSREAPPESYEEEYNPSAYGGYNSNQYTGDAHEYESNAYDDFDGSCEEEEDS